MIGVYIFWTVIFLAFTPIPYVAYGMWVRRDERHGRCSTCHQPWARQVVLPADQMYGDSVVTTYVCPNGHKSVPQGNRRFAEW